ncbi:MAG: cell envelope integrity protein CreD [Nitrospirota bacterium]
MVDAARNLFDAIRTSPLVRLLLIGFLLLVLQIPILMINGQIGEREERRRTAVTEVTEKWGKEQTVIGPMLTVPYVWRWTEPGEGGKQRIRTEVRHATFLPDDLTIQGRMESETRYRGIFEVPVYRMTLEVTGRFTKPDFTDWGVDSKEVQWDRAALSVRISDARAIQNQATLNWNGRDEPFLPGIGEFGGTKPGIHAALKGRLAGDRFEFSFPLVLNGSDGAFFAPLGQTTTVKVTSNWGNPSFQGNWLPNDRVVTDKSFEANWSIPHLGRNYPQHWTSDTDLGSVIEASQFGLRLISPVDQYRMAHRSMKYEALFLLLTFVSIWLFEVLAKIRVHSIQYLLVGAAMALFYLLELSLSEHLGFPVTYVIASAAVVGLISAYSISILKQAKRGAVMGVIVAALYGYLYVLLNNEDYALLVGSIGLFLILGLVMYLTRRIDWFAMNK